MAKRLGMQKLEQRFVGTSPEMPVVVEQANEVTESGTYPSAERAAREVTLIVYGWQNVQPGTLSWVFPSFSAAMKAANALRNATQWAILGGNDASGPVLAEQND